MAGPFQSLWTPKPPPKPNGTTRELLCADVGTLDAVLLPLVGETLALSDGHGPDANGDLTWMRPKVIPLTRTGAKPYITLSIEFKLLGHSVGSRKNWIDVVIEGDCGEQGTLRLGFPSCFLSGSGPRGWQLHLVTPQSAPAPSAVAQKPLLPPELAGEPEPPDPKDCSEDSAKRKRDDIFKKMFG